MSEHILFKQLRYFIKGHSLEELLETIVYFNVRAPSIYFSLQVFVLATGAFLVIRPWSWSCPSRFLFNFLIL